MEILSQVIHKQDLMKRSEVLFDDCMVKGVVDIDQKLLAIDAELHSDLEEMLLDQGSKQESLWGINLYPEEEGEDFLEFDSIFNIRPRQGNRSRGVEDEKTQQRIREVIDQWIQ